MARGGTESGYAVDPAFGVAEAAARDEREDQERDGGSGEEYGVHAELAPAERVPQLLGRLLELEGLLVEAISLVDEELDFLAALQHLLDVFHHDVLDVVQLRFYLRQVVRARVRVVERHLPLHRRRKLQVHGEGPVREGNERLKKRKEKTERSAAVAVSRETRACAHARVVVVSLSLSLSRSAAPHGAVLTL